jgi:hypothetical protein
MGILPTRGSRARKLLSVSALAMTGGSGSTPQELTSEVACQEKD